MKEERQIVGVVGAMEEEEEEDESAGLPRAVISFSNECRQIGIPLEIVECMSAGNAEEIDVSAPRPRLSWNRCEIDEIESARVDRPVAGSVADALRTLVFLNMRGRIDPTRYPLGFFSLYANRAITSDAETRTDVCSGRKEGSALGPR